MREDPGRMPGLVGMKLVRLSAAFKHTPNRTVRWCFATAWLVTAPLLFLGLWLGFRRDAGACLVLLLPILATVATTLVLYGSIRFRDAVSPMLVVPVGVALAWLSRRGWRTTSVPR